MTVAKRLTYSKMQASVGKQLSLAAGLLTLGGLAGLGAGCGAQEPPRAQEAPPVAVRVAAVTEEDLRRSIAYVGTVHSRREVKVLAQTAGNVVALTGEGEVASKGQALAKIATPEADARLSRTEAEVERATTERDFLCRTFDTDQKLGAAGAISTTQVDMSRRACEAAGAALSAAEAGSREAGVGRSKRLETAPFAGRVLQWLVEPGQNVMPGTPLLFFGSHDRELRVAVAERDLARGVGAGTPVLVNFQGKSFRVQVTSVAPVAVGLGRTVEVRAPLPDDAAFGHGTSVRVDFVLAEVKGGLVVPDVALSRQGERSVVFVIAGERAQVVPVSPGISSQSFVAVQGDLAPGAHVAVSNLDLLKDGARVFAVASARAGPVQP